MSFLNSLFDSKEVVIPSSKTNQPQYNCTPQTDQQITKSPPQEPNLLKQKNNSPLQKHRQRLSCISERESAIFTTPADLARIRNSITLKAAPSNDIRDIPFDRILSSQDLQRFTKSLILKLEKGYSPKLTNYTIKVDGLSFPKKFKKRQDGIVIFSANLKNKANLNNINGTTLTTSTGITNNTSTNNTNNSNNNNNNNNEDLLDIELPFDIEGFHDKFLFCIFSVPDLCQYKLKLNINNDYTELATLIDSVSLKLNYEIPYPIQCKTVVLLSKTKIQINPIVNSIIEITDLKSNKKYIINHLATETATIGKDENCTVKIQESDDKEISLFHLTLFHDAKEKKWFMKDGSDLKESRNGTYFLGMESMVLFSGMKLKIKGSVFSIKIDK